MAVSKALRFEILRRDNHTCRYCGATAPDAVLQIDHVVPTTLGGDDAPANLVTACRDCNSGKRATPPGAPLVADVAQDAMRWAMAMKRATEDALEARSKYIAIEKTIYGIFEGLVRYLPPDFGSSVQRYAIEGLAEEELIDAACSALGAMHIPPSRIWPYFCGICKNKLAERHRVARALIDGGVV